MDGIFFWISVISVIIAFRSLGRVKKLEKEFKQFLSTYENNSIKQPDTITETHTVDKPSVEAADDINISSESIPDTHKIVITAPKKRKKQKVFKEKIMKKFLENWTGILGTVILVSGFSFLGIYTAYKMSAFARFSIFLFTTILILVLTSWFEKKNLFLKLSMWLKSGAAAIFLFACVGSGGIPGLQWIDNQGAALLLLLAGILLNMYIGYMSKNQVIVSVHLFLSLVSLSIAPATVLILSIGAVVTLMSISMTYKEKWDWNLLITISLFFIYHLFWFFNLDQENINQFHHFAGISLVFIVGIAAFFNHYRKVYSTGKFDKLPFFTHFLNWIYLSLGLFIHGSLIQYKVLILIVAAVSSYLIAKRAGKLNIRWLYITDTVAAQIIMVTAILSLYSDSFDYFYVFAVLYLESIVFLIIVSLEKEMLLSKIAYGFFILSGLLLVAEQFNSSISINNNSKSLILLICLIISGLLYYKAIKDKVVFAEIDRKYYSLSSIIIVLFIFSIFINNYEYLWCSSLLLLLTVPFILIRERYQNNVLAVSIIVLSIVSHILIWTNTEVILFADKLLLYLPMFVLSGFMIRFSYVESKNKYSNSFGSYLFQLHLMCVVYLLFNNISPFLPAILWLLISLSNIEIAENMIKKDINKKYLSNIPEYLFNISILLIASFAARHIIVHLQSGSYIGYFRVRLVLELYAVAVFIYILRREKQLIKAKSYLTALDSYLLEFTALFIAITIVIEISKLWRPVVWVIAAIAAVILSNFEDKKYRRLLFYSVFIAVGGALQLGFVTSLLVLPAKFDSKWLSGIITIALYVYYLIIFRKHRSGFVVTDNKYLNIISKISSKMEKTINIWVYYPFFACIAVYIFWTFDKNILTLLFVAESLLVFILSLVFKENNFRFLSLAGIAACLVRLIFFDFSNSGTIARALVFIGVGLLMVVMNIVYLKYKDRIAL